MGFRDAVTSNVKSLGAVWDDAKDLVSGIGNTIGQAVQAGVSEFITNKDESKGIKDYDKFQQYSAQLNDPTLGQTERDNVLGLMKQDNVIDPVKFSQWQTKQSEKKIVPAEQDLDAVRKEIESNIKDELSKADTRYKKDAIIGHVDEIMKDYQDLADSYRQTKKDNPNVDDKLWEGNKKRWLQIIKDKSKQFSENVLRGATDDEAYDKMIADDNGAANELVDVDQGWRMYLYNEQIRNDFGKSRDELKSGNIIGGLYNGFKGIMNSVSALGTEAGDILEEGKQKLGYYDSLEEWSNLNLEKGALNSIKSRGFELFDGANRILPSVAEIRAGNKAMESFKIEQLITRGLESSKYLRLADEAFAATDNIAAYSLDAIKPSKAAKFISENLGDALLFDAAAQSAMGRPLTDDDFLQNWMMNIPINAGLSMLVKGGIKDLGLPKINIADGMRSKELIESIANNAKLTDDDISKMLVFDKYNKQATKDINIADISYQGVQTRINDAMAKAQEYVANLKAGTEDFDSKVLKTQISNLNDNGADSYMKQGNVYDSMIERTNLMNTKLQQRVSDVNYIPQLQKITISNMGFKDAEIKAVIDSSQVSQVTKDIVARQLISDNKLLTNDTKDAASKYVDALRTSPSTISKELQTIYNDLTEQLVLKNPQKLKVGDMVGPYIYQGNNIFKNIAGQEIGMDVMMHDIRLARGTYKGSAQVFKGVDAISNTEARLSYALRNQPAFPSNKDAEDLIISDIFGRIREIPGAEGKRSVEHVFNYGSDHINPNMDAPTINKFGKSIFEPFGIKFTLRAEGGLVVTGKPAAVQDLLDTVRGLQAKGFSYASMTDKEMSAFKAIHIGEFAEAYGNKLEGTTWFDSIFKKVDGGYNMNFKVINPASAGKQMNLYAKTFESANEVAAQYSITDMLADAMVIQGKTNKEVFASEVRRVTKLNNPVITNIINKYGDFVDTYVKDVPKTDKLNISSILGQVFGSIVSDRILLRTLSILPDDAARTLTNSIIVRLLNKDRGGDVLLRTFKTILENDKNINASFIRPFFSAVETLTKDYAGDVGKTFNNIINSKRLIEIGRLVTRISSEDATLFKEQLSKLPKEIDDIVLAEATQEEIEKLVRSQVYNSLSKRGIPSEKFAKSLTDKYTRGIMNMKDRLLKRGDDAQVKLIVPGHIDDTFFYQKLSDGIEKISVPTLVDADIFLYIKNKDNFFDVAYKHEGSHYILDKQGEKEYFTSLVNSIKKLRELPVELHDVVYGYKAIEADIKPIMDKAYEIYHSAFGTTNGPIELSNGFHTLSKDIEEILIDQIALGSRYMDTSEINNLVKVTNDLYNISYALRNSPMGNVPMSANEFQAYLNGHLGRQYLLSDVLTPSILSKSDLADTGVKRVLVYDDSFKKSVTEEYIDYEIREGGMVSLSQLLGNKLPKDGVEYIIPDSTLKMIANKGDMKLLSDYKTYGIKMNPIYKENNMFKILMDDKQNIEDFVPGKGTKKTIDITAYDNNISKQLESITTKQPYSKDSSYVNTIGNNIWKEYGFNNDTTIPVSEALVGLWKASRSADAFIAKIDALIKVSGTKDHLNAVFVTLKSILIGEDTLKAIPEGMNPEHFILNKAIGNILTSQGLYSEGTIDLLNKSAQAVLKDKEFMNILGGNVDGYINKIVSFINETGLRDKEAKDLVSRDDLSLAINNYLRTLDEKAFVENIIENFGLDAKSFGKISTDYGKIDIREALQSIDILDVFNKNISDMSLEYKPGVFTIQETKPSMFIDYNTSTIARHTYMLDKAAGNTQTLDIIGRNKNIRDFVENPNKFKKIYATETMGLDWLEETVPGLYKQTTFKVGGQIYLPKTANLYEVILKAVQGDKKIVMQVGDEIKTYQGGNFWRAPIFAKFDELGTANEETILKNMFSTMSPFQLKKFGGAQAKLYNLIKNTQFAGQWKSGFEELLDRTAKTIDGDEFKILGYRPTLISETQKNLPDFEKVDADGNWINDIDYEVDEVVSPVYFTKESDQDFQAAVEILGANEKEYGDISAANLSDIKVTDRYIDVLVQNDKGILHEATYDTIEKSLSDVTKYTEPKRVADTMVIDKNMFEKINNIEKNALDSLGC